jgi:peptidoglycan/LPS O-acetylase OafA/YrhL
VQINRHYDGTDFITGLRAVAVFLVFLIHSGGGGLGDVNEFLNTFVDFGRYGVQMFFVISGFTIFYQLNEGCYSLRKFLLIRISRISIPYFPILFIIFIYINIGGWQFNGWAYRFNEGGVSIENLLMHLTYLASFDLRYANTIIGVEWTLHIEVFFYCVIGFLLTRGFVKRLPSNIIFWLTVWLSVAIVFGPFGYTGTLDPLLIIWMPFIYGWMFILGGVAFYIRKEIASRISNSLANKLSDLFIALSLLLLIGLVAANATGIINQLLSVGAGTVHFINGLAFSLLTALLIVTTRDAGKFSWVLTNKAVLSFGSISFSFYLIHYIIILSKVSSELFEIGGQTEIFVSDLLITILVSFVWYLLFEKLLYQKAKGVINKFFVDSVQPEINKRLK